MVDLSLLSINEKAPYRVEELHKPGIFRFTTDNGVVIAIQFEADDLLSCAETYQLIVINLNQRKSPRDKKVKETILAIVEEFFSKNQAALLYICETGDGKQSMRSRLFELWFHAYRRQKRFLMFTACITDDDGTDNYATLIVRVDNPQAACLFAEFTETTQLLSEKPNTETH